MSTASPESPDLRPLPHHACIAGTEFLLIDHTTTLRSLEAQIRANAACYRLARGS
jgi:predicted metal-dependent phosphoesterase TrpH